MSGGYFNYDQYRLNDIASAIEELIKQNDDTSLNEYGDPRGRGYTPETIEKFRETVHELRRSEEMAQRIDWLVSDDDSQESFHRRWKEEVRAPYGREKSLAESIAHFLYWSGWIENRDASAIAIEPDSGEPIQCGIRTFQRLEAALADVYPNWQTWNENYKI